MNLVNVIKHQLMSEPRTWFHILHFCPIVMSHVLVLVHTRPSINMKNAADSVYDLEFIILKVSNETRKCFIRTTPQTAISPPGSLFFPPRSCEGKRGLPGNEVTKTFCKCNKDYGSSKQQKQQLRNLTASNRLFN